MVRITFEGNFCDISKCRKVEDLPKEALDYIRYIENCIRDAFNLKATPLKFIVRERSKETK